MKSSQGRKPKAKKSPDRAAARPGCSIVGVGASAGGLEAFTQLLNQLPVDTGFGFVLVQHLDPKHESALAHLLTRATAMPVQEVTNNLRVQPNHVYIIPPNANLGIAGGILKLQPRLNHRVAARSIDNFFKALAKDQAGRAIGVILSGTATDGTLGLEAIKAEGGLTFAQDDSASYNSMPRSAAAAGCVDFVLSPENIARELTRIAKHPYVARRAPDRELPPGRSRPQPAHSPKATRAPAGSLDQPGYDKVLLLLRNHTGVDFSLYKSSTIQRRIARRIVLRQQDTLDGYATFLRGNPKELDALFSDTLISVTSFFRNADAFAALQRKVMAPLLAQRGDEPIRIWVLGCSTGQEAYSIAMAYAELAEKTPHARKLQVFATDLNEANLDRGRQGHFAKGLVQDVSTEHLRRFFTAEHGGYRVIKALREQVVFARHNLITDPPFSRMDLISCRNVMIYLEPSLQKKLIPAFHYALKPDGFLFLGASESIGAFTELFAPADKKQKIFAKKAARTVAFSLPVKSEPGSQRLPGHLPQLPAPSGRSPGGAVESFQGELSAEREADRVTVNQFAPPSVLINADLQILQFRGPTGAFLEPPTGKASFDLLKMARDGLMLPLRTALNRAKKENQAVRLDHVPVTLYGKTRAVSVEVVPLKNLKERRYLVLFADSEKRGPTLPAEPSAITPPPRPRSKKEESSRIAALERDLAETRDYLQSIQEYQEAANEELQAANEEGQSANEELQSLNEELETSKEELESTNEELMTVNEEMVSRNAELNHLSADLTNIQTSANLVVVLLGRDLTIRRFTEQAAKQFRLQAADVGRPMSGIRHNLHLPDLDGLIKDVIDRVHGCEHEVRATDGRWYSLRVRPYLTMDKKVDGAVLVLVDIDDLKKTERIVTGAHEHATAIIRTVPNPLVILNAHLRLQSANESFYRTFKLTEAETKDRSIFEVGHGSWNIPQLRLLLEKILPKKSFFNDFEVTHAFKKIGVRTLLLNARLLVEPGGKSKEILLGLHDITERKHAEEALVDARGKLVEHALELEGTVARRTRELTAANQQLAAAVVSTRLSEEEYRKLYLDSQVTHKKLRLVTHQVITAQEDERKRISRELHDEVVQTLVAINVELSTLVHGNAAGTRHLKDKIARTQRLVENSVEAVHRFARDLRPAVLDDLGLIPALHVYCKALAERKKIKIHLTAFGGVEALANDQRTVLFRVAQEALTNIVRHARATQVELAIRKISGAIRMEISDNGKSFPVKKVLQAKGRKRLGLVGMQERPEMVGGRLVTESTPGQGTTVRAEIPFTPEKSKK